MKLVRLGILSVLLVAGAGEANANYHTVGWVNTFVPGGGEFLLGNYGYGSLQAILEIGTFYTGYRMSRRSPMTLDGVPESLPAPSSLGHRRTVRGASSSAVTHALYADWFQEFGLKYHFVNVFNAYRGSGENTTIGNQKLDDTSTKQLFLAPIRWSNISNPWVYPALGITAATLVYSYQQALRPGGMSRVSRLNTSSQRLYDITYVGVFPIGSAAPEEMFYRGFLQHEFYGAVPSGLFSILATSMAYTFSHSSEDRVSAAITGIYLSLMTHENGGSLSQAIAYHFWADLMAGLYEITLVRKESGKIPLFHFTQEFN